APKSLYLLCRCSRSVLSLLLFLLLLPLPPSFSPLRPPPTPTLFPYTTLFRSPLPSSCTRSVVSVLPLQRGLVMERFLNSRLSTSDRKSTRLNSSHVSISYAVFCLKKKRRMKELTCNNHPTQTRTR